MLDRISTVRSRTLGARLRQAREQAGYPSLAGLAAQLGWSQGRLSRLENGKRGGADVDISAYLACCGVTGPERVYLLTLCRDTYERSWLHTRADALADPVGTLILHETTATAIHGYHPFAIPDLLQTEDYMSALLPSTNTTTGTPTADPMPARHNRQALFHQYRATACIFFIAQQVLHRCVGGTRVMNDQLLHLALMSNRPGCVVRVLPDVLDLGMFGGSFQLMEYIDHDPVVYTTTLANSLFLEEPHDTAIFHTTLKQLEQVALGPSESRDLITHLAHQYESQNAGR